MVGLMKVCNSSDGFLRIGARYSSPPQLLSVVGPTSTPWSENYPVPKELTKEQLTEIEDAFISAIKRAEQAGCEFPSV